MRRTGHGQEERQKDLKHFLKFKGLINPAVTRSMAPGMTANFVGSASYILFGKCERWMRKPLPASQAGFESPHLLLLVIEARTS